MRCPGTASERLPRAATITTASPSISNACSARSGPSCRRRNMSLPDAAILVVDDNDDNRYAFCRRLEREGYQDIETAVNGREALERLAARSCDLVLLDIQMPEFDGYEVLARMKADSILRQVPVIMISAVSELNGVLAASSSAPKTSCPNHLTAPSCVRGSAPASSASGS